MQELSVHDITVRYNELQRTRESVAQAEVVENELRMELHKAQNRRHDQRTVVGDLRNRVTDFTADEKQNIVEVVRSWRAAAMEFDRLSAILAAAEERHQEAVKWTNTAVQNRRKAYMDLLELVGDSEALSWEKSRA